MVKGQLGTFNQTADTNVTNITQTMRNLQKKGKMINGSPKHKLLLLSHYLEVLEYTQQFFTLSHLHVTEMLLSYVLYEDKFLS